MFYTLPTFLKNCQSDWWLVFSFLFVNLTSWKWSGKLDLILCNTRRTIISKFHRRPNRLYCIGTMTCRSSMYNLTWIQLRSFQLWVTMCPSFLLYSEIDFEEIEMSMPQTIFNTNWIEPKEVRTHCNSSSSFEFMFNLLPL